MTTIADGLKDVFLAGVGAMALGAEKTQELVEQLIAKGEITVEQGKAINSEVLKQAQATAERVGRDAQTAAGEAAHQLSLIHIYWACPRKSWRIASSYHARPSPTGKPTAPIPMCRACFS